MRGARSLRLKPLDGQGMEASNRRMNSVRPGSVRPGASRSQPDIDLAEQPLRPTLPMRSESDPPLRPTISMPPPRASEAPRTGRRGAVLVGAAAMLAGVAILVVGLRFRHKDDGGVGSWIPYTRVVADKDDAPNVFPAGSARADATLDRKGRSPIAGGLLFIPPAFRSEDGSYDLVLHFHGNTDVVEESFALAGVNAVVVATNLGNGSGAYETKFENPQNYQDILVRVQNALEKRGLRGAHRARTALSAWSAGYGAVQRSLEHPEIFADVDAVLLEDGIHAGYLPDSTTLDVAKIAAFEKFATEAVAGKKLFSITHSDIKPITYAGTHETCDALLADEHVERVPLADAPVMPPLKSIEGVVARKSLRPLEPRTIARSGGLIVRGFAGEQPEDHSAHLFGMAATTLPDLVEHWAKSPAK